ncbi:cadherin-like beta sandwich domain-containing protein, partial [Mucilaginibacter sp. OK098]|uniref:cadherin-like beta sandwich domain-containing protein n=1 Tax=Mucilaginibacter sp. OK098 TaxID=1855297 RepID=UPI00091B7751
MKILYLKAFCKILMILLFSAFFQNVKAINRVGSIKKLMLIDPDFKIRDTTKHISKNKANYKGVSNVQDPPEDGVDDNIVARHEQEVKRTMDPALKIVPVERLIQARKIKDQLLIQHASNIKGLSSTNTISSIGWTERGPNNVGGRTRALLFDLNDKANGYKKVFAGGVGGGLWYTTDITAATVIWHKINDFFESIAISCITQNPVNPLEIYAGTGEGWFNGDAIQGLGVWKSSDGGTTWNRLTSTSTFTSTNSILVDKNGAVYVAGVGLGIQKSSDGGTTWNQVIAAPGDGADLQLAANGDVYASTGVFSTGNIFMSDFSVNGANTGNAGTWTNITPETTGVITPATQSWWRIKLACAPGNSNIVYALFEGNNTYDLTSVQQYNKGTNTWGVKAVPPGSSFSNGQAWYSIAAAVDPNNANTLFAGSLDAVRSADGGSTWTPITQWYTGEISGMTASQYVHADHHAYVYPPGSSSRLLMGTDGGIFYTPSANATGGTLPAFTAQNSGYNVTQFYSVALHPTNNNYALAGAQDNGTQQFNAAGLNSTTEVTGGDGGDAFIDQLNGNTQIASYVYNNHWISLDNGVSFTEHFFGNTGSFINPSDYDSNQKNLYSGYGANQYFRWNNVISAGSPSTSIVTVAGFNSSNITSVTVSPITSNRVYFGLDNGTIAVVNNANVGTSNASVILSPNPALNNISVSCVAIDPASENHILVSYFNYGIVSLFETKNATAATPVWTAVEGNLPDMPVRWAMFYPGDVSKALIATELGVWTTDALSGNSTIWAPSNSGLANVEVDMLKFRASDRTLAAATHGRGLFTTILPAGLPTISYSSPHTYNVGTAISSLAPTSSGVAAPGYSASPVTAGSGFNNPYGVAADAPGNIYVADYGNNAVKKIPVGGGAPVTIGSGFSNPKGVAVDAAGNVYVADNGNNAVKKIPVGGGAPITLGSGFNQPYGVAVDGAGNVYVADYGNNAVKKIPVGGGAPVTLGSGFSNPGGVAVDAAGNVYVTDYGHNLVKKIPVGGGAPITIGSGFNQSVGIAADAAGNVYVGDNGNNAVKQILVGGGAPVTIGSGFSNPKGVAVDGAGTVLVADYLNNAVKKIVPVGGYYIAPFLPAGLSFATATGIVSGTPTVASRATNYTITAYNADGSSIATLNIKVISNNAALANLIISSGTLNPVFAAATLSYTANVPNAVSTLKITPTASDVNATIKINGTTVASGTTSASLPLAVGTNTITTIVTSSDGTATKTYTLTVNRSAVLSSNALLTSIKASPVSTLTAVSGPGYKNYKT